MIWENGCRVIVMLTKELENGKEKCCRYWPMSVKDTINFSTLKITMTQSKHNEQHIWEREFVLTKDGQTRIVHQFQATEWPDHGLPKHPATFLSLIHKVNEINTVDLEDRSKNPPICVHCSAGIGRSGTFCVVNNLVQYIKFYVNKHKRMPPINLLRTVLELRKQRPGMVQTREQYMFCYYVVKEEYHRIKKTLNIVQNE
eukprot:TRINITY_DN339_c0_g1_i2.p1 TRINITY_DN339_c0_g1~~TRINITY_DN339_c0_g1_i2.p1  ORF type:complete len:200 (-),score=15.40 TRINITY_DN339_c0_g1_i2:100-699(-)